MKVDVPNAICINLKCGKVIVRVWDTECSEDKGGCQQAKNPEFDPSDPHDIRRGSSASPSLSSGLHMSAVAPRKH